MRFLSSLLLCLLLVFPCIAQEETSEPQVQKSLNMVIGGQHPPTSNILFVVDTSGSMDQSQVADAIQAVCGIAETPLDDLQVAAINFGSRVSRWPGTEDVDPQTGKPMSRPGWSLMPSANNLRALRDWLHTKDGGSTEIIAAINQAFASTNGQNGAQSVRQLSIIIVSDGDFTNFAGLRAAIDRQQQVRQRAGLDRVAIGFFGIDVTNNDDAEIRATVGEGASRCSIGYMRMIYTRIFEEDD